MSIWPQMAVGGSLAIIIIRDVLKFIQDKKNNDSIEELDRKIDLILQSVNSLYHWHSKEDRDGVKVWYNNSVHTKLDGVIKTIELLKKKET